MVITLFWSFMQHIHSIYNNPQHHKTTEKWHHDFFYFSYFPILTVLDVEGDNMMVKYISMMALQKQLHFNTLRPEQNECHFPDEICKCIFLNENVWISMMISVKFVPKGPINNIPTLVQTMACFRPGDKPLIEPMMVSLLMHICVTWPQWIKSIYGSLWSRRVTNNTHISRITTVFINILPFYTPKTDTSNWLSLSQPKMMMAPYETIRWSHIVKMIQSAWGSTYSMK